MKLLLKAKFPISPFNEMVKNGTVGATIGKILDTVKPEAAYFTEMDGHRGAIMLVNLDDPAQIPALAEPFFLALNADVEFHIVMSPDDLKRAGLEEIGKKW